MDIFLVGDIFLGDQLSCLGFGVNSATACVGYGGLFQMARDNFKGGSISIGNLESVLYDPEPYQQSGVSGILNRGRSSGAKAISEAGITAVSLANNHIFDYGVSGLNHTIDQLDFNGVIHFGTKRKPVSYLDISGCKLALMA